MRPRILLIHAYEPSIAPIVEAFRIGWPEAEVLNLLDESLYADVGVDGILPDGMTERIETLLRHGVASGADGMIMTGSTFGPAVAVARQGVAVPVLKADEGLSNEAVARGSPILLLCTAARAVPVIHDTILASARRSGATPTVKGRTVAGAKDAIARGDHETHDGLIADAIRSAAPDDVVVLGQVSMGPALSRVSRETAARVINGPDASVRMLRGRLSC